MSGWVKLHSQVLENDVWLNDRTAWHIFEYLLIKAYSGKPQGTVSTTRYKIGNGVGINNNTVFNALNRLKTAGMIKTSSTSNKTVIRICNWHNYQGNGQQLNQQSINNVSTMYQHSYKNKIIDKDNIVPNGTSEQVRRVYDLFINSFDKNPNTYKLSDSRKNKIKVRLRDAGEEMLTRAINNTAVSQFHRGDNDRSWVADLDFIIRSYEQVERLAGTEQSKARDLKEFV